MAASTGEVVSDMAMRLLAQLGDGRDAFFSPASVAIALAMTSAGAAGDTLEQMRRCLFSGLGDNELHGAMSALAKAMTAAQDKAELTSANRLFGHRGFDVLAAFEQRLRSQYACEWQSVDFGDAASAAAAVNAFVAAATREKITELVSAASFDALTRLVLVNAVYFKADWKKKFAERSTNKQTFYCAPGQHVQVDMMHAKSKFLYAEDNDVQVLGLPYAAEHLALVVVLPRERFGLAAVESALTGRRFVELIGRMTGDEDVKVSLPKLHLEQEFELSKALAVLGVDKLFDEAEADLSGMTGARDLFVSRVLHKAFVDVNEEGCEAAAATAVVMRMRCAMIVDEPIQVVVDHPFLLAIVDTNLKAPLFLGRVSMMSA